MILASKSPQRKALLKALGIDFDVLLPDYGEEDIPGEPPAGLVERYSRGKALSVLPRISATSKKSAVLGVDTMVVVDGKALGKAADEDEALSFVSLLSGRTHQVYSGITLIMPTQGSAIDGTPVEKGFAEYTGHAVTEVVFREISRSELELYVSLGEWRGRAGAYAIQGRASAFVEEVRGDYANVVGLPVPLLISGLNKYGLWPPDSWKGKPET
ncbi:MAG: Maf family protein [Thermoleophilia bacterium]